MTTPTVTEVPVTREGCKESPPQHGGDKVFTAKGWIARSTFDRRARAEAKRQRTDIHPDRIHV